MDNSVVQETVAATRETVVSKTTTLADVALLAGVTKAAVSFAFSGKRKISQKTRERIFAAAKTLNYHPNPHAQRLSSGSAKNVIGIFSLTLDHMAWRSMSHIHRLLAAHNYEAPLYTYGHMVDLMPDYEPLLATLCRQLPEGIICNTRRLPPEASSFLRKYQQDGGTLVCLDSLVDVECDQVIFDRETNTYLAARHLLEAGHRHIGLCDLNVRDASRARAQGFRRAMSEFGVKIKDSYLFESGHYEEGGAQLAQQFLAMKKRPTGMCIVNDMQAATFVHQVLLAGLRVPEDVSVVSLDGLPASQYGMVPLTIVTQPWEAIAAKSVECLLRRLSGANVSAPERSTFIGEVVTRQSVRQL